MRRVTDDLLRPEVPARMREPIEFLAALGDAEGIRCYFERAGVRGRRAAPWADPVARFVRSWPGVAPGWVVLVCANTTTVNEWLVHHPLPVFEFVRRFDRLWYPELISAEVADSARCECAGAELCDRWLRLDLCSGTTANGGSDFGGSVRSGGVSRGGGGSRAAKHGSGGG